VIQVNITLLIQLVNFLLLLVILNAFLYKPILAKIREREAAIKRDRSEAEALARRVEEQEKRHQDELSKARQTAAEVVAATHGEAPWVATGDNEVIPYVYAYYRRKFEAMPDNEEEDQAPQLVPMQ